MSAMHDNPAIFPRLPAAEPDPDVWPLLVEPNRGAPWETCWEYVVTHDLSETEGAAFWTAANLVYEAMKGDA